MQFSGIDLEMNGT